MEKEAKKEMKKIAASRIGELKIEQSLLLDGIDRATDRRRRERLIKELDLVHEAIKLNHDLNTGRVFIGLQ